ncbi:hypothetical protein EV363DRAFT_1307129 [Boletus edulis]|nr:hypothetical protein EV363DRAFT_1307129 [Boletus edulis]
MKSHGQKITKNSINTLQTPAKHKTIPPTPPPLTEEKIEENQKPSVQDEIPRSENHQKFNQHSTIPPTPPPLTEEKIEENQKPSVQDEIPRSENHQKFNQHSSLRLRKSVVTKANKIQKKSQTPAKHKTIPPTPPPLTEEKIEENQKPSVQDEIPRSENHQKFNQHSSLRLRKSVVTKANKIQKKAKHQQNTRQSRPLHPRSLRRKSRKIRNRVSKMKSHGQKITKNSINTLQTPAKHKTIPPTPPPLTEEKIEENQKPSVQDEIPRSENHQKFNQHSSLRLRKSVVTKANKIQKKSQTPAKHKTIPPTPPPLTEEKIEENQKPSVQDEIPRSENHQKFNQHSTIPPTPPPLTEEKIEENQKPSVQDEIPRSENHQKFNQHSANKIQKKAKHQPKHKTIPPTPPPLTEEKIEENQKPSVQDEIPRSENHQKFNQHSRLFHEILASPLPGNQHQVYQSQLRVG